MRTSLTVLALATLVLGACSDENTMPTELDPSLSLHYGASEATVTSGADSGPGSFRAAIQAANDNASIRSIRFARRVDLALLESTVTYEGGQPLSIDGSGVTIDASAVAGTALVVTGGSSLGLADLTIKNAAKDGILVDVPATASGVVSVDLRNVTLSGHGEYGLHIDDQTGGSEASLSLTVEQSRILDTGFEPSISDRDGIRVDEGGPGDIVSRISRSTFTGNAADGIEYDETGDGDVRVTVFNSVFDDNGTQPQNEDDLEDGFDIDEAGDGSIYALFLEVSTSGNDDGGLDLDEEGPGDIVMWLNHVVSANNTEENIKASEDADAEDTEELDGSGGIWFRLMNVVSLNSSDNGIQLEEFGIGDVNGEVVHSVSSDNGDDGLNIEQADEGEGTVRLQASTFQGNADKQKNLKGVTVIGG